MCSDADIMARVQAGDIDRFGDLVLRYHDRLLRFAQSKLGHRAAAEDLVQETLLAAFGARDTYRPQFAFSTWLWTILINLCRRDARRQNSAQLRPTRRTGDIGRVVDGSESSLEQMLREEQRVEVHRLLDALPEAQADALRLRFFGELSYDEIAETMGCSVSGAKRRVKTGLLKLSRLAPAAFEDVSESPALEHER